ncbi:MAG: TonB-dependent receptor family protein [Bacteroidota bacterium]
MKIVVTLIFLCSFFGLKAQTFKGTVRDEKQQPLPGAIVRLIQKDTLVTAIDTAGQFSLQIKSPGTYHLVISSIGFRSLEAIIALNKDTSGVFMLKNATTQLSDVTIKGTVPAVERGLDKTVVNVAQNINNDGATVLEVMQRLPGVQMTTEGQVSLAGRSGVNVLIDGKPTYLAASDLAALLGSMPSSEVQKIEIMSNPSAKYDAAGTSGIINIVRKRNKKAGFNGSANASIGQGYYGKYNGGLTLNYQTLNYNLQFSQTYAYNHNFTNRTVISDILSTEQASVTDGNNTGRNYRPTLNLDLFLSKKTTLSLSATAGFGKADNLLVSHMDLLDSLRNKTGHIDFNSQLKDDPFNYTTGLQLARQLDTNGRNLSINADHSEYRNFPIQNNVDNTGNSLLLQHRQLGIWSAKADYVQPLKNKEILEAGLKSSYVNAKNDNNENNQSTTAINSENINAAYINWKSSFQKLELQAGLRGEQTITQGQQLYQNYFQLFPTLFAAYKFNDRHTFTARFGRRIERPAYNELVPFRRPQTATLFFEGAPNLKPHISHHSELSWAWQNEVFITFGYDLDKDYIQTFPYVDASKSTLTRRPTNVQGAHSWNLDFAYSKKIIGWWSTETTASLYRNAFSGEANSYSLNSSGIPTLYLSANNSMAIANQWSAQADFEYNSKRQIVNSTFGTYSILSIGIKRQLLNNQASLSLNARNILDSEGHNAIDRNAGLYQYSYFNFYTRAVTLNFTYRFGNANTAKIKTGSASAEEQQRARN